MTEQYPQRNINNPEGAETRANAVGDANFRLTAADTGKLLILDTTAVAGDAQLPLAAEAGGGAEIGIVASAGGTNALTIAVTGADTLVTPTTAPANPAVSSDATFTLRSDGVSTWYIMNGLA